MTRVALGMTKGGGWLLARCLVPTRKAWLLYKAALAVVTSLLIWYHYVNSALSIYQIGKQDERKFSDQTFR